MRHQEPWLVQVNWETVDWIDYSCMNFLLVPWSFDLSPYHKPCLTSSCFFSILDYSVSHRILTFSFISPDFWPISSAHSYCHWIFSSHFAMIYLVEVTAPCISSNVVSTKSEEVKWLTKASEFYLSHNRTGKPLPRAWCHGISAPLSVSSPVDYSLLLSAAFITTWWYNLRKMGKKVILSLVLFVGTTTR